MRGERGWLALEGLYWLENGLNRIGSDPENQVTLSSGDARAGTLELTGSRVILHPAPGTTMSIQGKPATEMVLKPDKSGDPTILSMANLDLMIIQRGDRFGVRVWNNANPRRAAFPGRRWYPIRPEYNLTARLLPHQGKTSITIPDVTGMDQEMAIAGSLSFSLAGLPLSLIAIAEDDTLFIIFKDETSGKETYPAGRYIYTDVAPDGTVALDFNRAYNPPCAFTDFATCPLPPPQNRLPVRIEAGEMAPV